MAFVDWSSAEQCGWWDGATNTSSIPLVRPGSNIMLRLLTLTFSQPGYRLLMLTETAGTGGRGGSHGHPARLPPSLPLPVLSSSQRCWADSVCPPPSNPPTPSPQDCSPRLACHSLLPGGLPAGAPERREAGKAASWLLAPPLASRVLRRR